MVTRGLKRIASISSIELEVIPGVGDHAIRKEPNSGFNISAATEVPRLLAWADVVMTTTSSIVVDVVLQGKTLVYPKYFHQNEMIFEDYDFCKTATNDEELVEILHAMSMDRFNREWKASDQDSMGRFIKEVVYGGQSKRDVLSGYVAEIEKIGAHYKATRDSFSLS